jgi:hypothetical protein
LEEKRIESLKASIFLLTIQEELVNGAIELQYFDIFVMESTRKKHRASIPQLLPTGILGSEDFGKGTNFQQIRKEKHTNEAWNFYASIDSPLRKKSKRWLRTMVGI